MSEPLKGGFGSFTPFKPPGSTGTPPSSNVFGNTTATTNTGTNAQTTATPNAFGGGTSGGSNAFANIGAKPLFGAGATGTTSSTAGNAFAGFVPNPSTNTNAQNASATPAAVSTPPPGGGLFGAKSAEQSANTSSTGATSNPQTSAPSLFGGSGGTTSGSQPANTTTSTSTPAAANIFGKPIEKNASTTAPATGASTGVPLFGGGNLFGKKPDTPTPAAANTNTTGATTGASPAAPLIFGLGAKKDDNADKDKQKEGTSTPTTAPSGGQFGQTPANKDTSTASTGSAFSMFGQKPAEGDKKDGTAPAATSSIGANPSGTGTPNPPAISVPPPSMLRGKTIEEIVNKWTSELETHVREFNRLAGEIAVWDRALIDNGNTIAALLQHVMMAEREQSDIEQSLKHVEDQQKELASTLEVYEKAAGEIFDAQGSGLRALDVGPADAERDKHYSLAAELNANLDDLSRSLLQMIESVNTLSEPESNDGGGAKTRDDAPLEQIAQILSSHLESLQWIDSAVKEVEGKVTDVERLVRDASVNGSRSTSGTGSLSGSVSGARSSGLRGSRGFGLR